MDFKQKYLKYKLKYIDLKKNQFRIQSGGAESIYDLSGKRLYCYSDEEGGNPFRLDDPYDTDSKGLFAQLSADFVFDNGLIVGLKQEDVALAFLGDLLDNSKYSIRLLEKYIRLKRSNPSRVILIGGNRDFNKIRMGIELFCLDPSKDGLDTLPWNGTYNIDQLRTRLQNPSYNFIFRDNRVPEYLKGVKLWDGAIGSLEAAYNLSFHDRLNIMFQKTKGINAFGNCGYTFIVDELNDILGPCDGSKLSINDELSAKIICVIQMIMSFNWDADELPPYLQPFNGLYIKYLEQCHVIALFNIDDKYGILSHSGYPKKLTYPFGYDADNEAMNFQSGSLTDVIPNIEKEKMELINQVKDKKINMYNEDVDYLINKFVHLTAGTTFENPAGAKSSNSPVVWGQTVPTNKRNNIKAQIRGGAGFKNWIDKDIVNDNKLYINDKTEDIVAYNIFGHAPQFFNPTLFRETDGNTLHVNLDISKIEANSGNNNSANNYSFAFFVIDSNGGDKLFGRIKFTEAMKVFPHPRNTLINLIKQINGMPKPTGTMASAEADAALNVVISKLKADKVAIENDIHKGTAYTDEEAIKYANTVHYYNIPINDKVIDISMASTIPETRVKVESFPPDFTKYLFTK